MVVYMAMFYDFRLIQVLGPEREIEKEDLPKLVYTEAVIKETLGFLPTVPISPKHIVHDVKLSKFSSLNNTILTYPWQLSHYLPILNLGSILGRQSSCRPLISAQIVF